MLYSCTRMATAGVKGLNQIRHSRVCLRVLRSASYFQDAAEDVGVTRKGTLLGYFSSLSCPVCEERTQCGLCAACRSDTQRVAVVTGCRLHEAQRRHSQLTQVIRVILVIVIVIISTHIFTPIAIETAGSPLMSLKTLADASQWQLRNHLKPRIPAHFSRDTTQ